MLSSLSPNPSARACRYFQAYIPRKSTLYVTALLRSFEHLAFDRSLDAQAGLSEFFVPPAMVEHFLSITNFLHQEGLMSQPQELDNRLYASLGSNNPTAS